MFVKCILATVGTAAFLSAACSSMAAEVKGLRPPAVPLVTHDPYFSTWSMADRLTDDWPRHWAKGITAMAGMARIDGKPYRFMGVAPADVPAMDQTSLKVTPTRSIYTFQAGGVSIEFTFMSPLLPHDVDVLTRPVTYLSWKTKATDGRTHDVRLYLDASGEWAVNSADQKVRWARSTCGEMSVLSIGTEDQPVLKRTGDGVKIDWGYFYAAGPRATASCMASDLACRGAFVADGSLPKADDTAMPRAASDNWPVLAFMYDLGKVGSRGVSRHAMLAYDEEWALELFHQKLRPYWRRSGMDVNALLAKAEKDYPSLNRKCAAFDKGLTAELTRVGGEKYSEIGVLAYRQGLAGCGYAEGTDGSLYIFPKENSSNGCVGTVDVIYPGAPLFLFFNPETMKAQLTPVLDYARSGRWPHPFAPHDLGTYPLANGQVYGGGERTEENQMPVEESADMILVTAAVAKIEGTADYANKYWPLLTKWAEYLREKGLDPENQLCTDDFTGHLAHNTNLSVKAILALAAYGSLAEQTGRKDVGADYTRLARDMAAKWVQMAADGDHTRLAFDKPGTWSQKYNLVWDKVLGLGVFPPELAKSEIAYYKTRMHRFGLPLDNRDPMTKTDWEVWTATLTETPEDFEMFIDPIYAYYGQTTNRISMTDWYNDRPDSGWFRARPVIGGVYMKMLSDPAAWKKWAKKAK